MGGGQLQETEAQLLSLALTEPGEGLSRDATASTGASHITGQDHPKAGHQSKPAPEGRGGVWPNSLPEEELLNRVTEMGRARN